MLDIFDKLVTPVLLYGCEVWGCSNLDKIESFYRKCINQILKTSKFTAKSMVYGESGRHEVKITVYCRIINFLASS